MSPGAAFMKAWRALAGLWPHGDSGAPRAHPPHPWRCSRRLLAQYAYRAGISIIEVLVVAAIMLALLAVGAPVYTRARDRAMVVRAIADISTIQKDISIFSSDHGELPTSLAQIATTATIDPWGHPYQYLKFTFSYTLGSSRAGSSTDSAGTDSTGGAGSSSSSGGGQGNGERGGAATDSQAGSSSDGASPSSGTETRPEEKEVRRDRHEKPLNSEYDLYSKGKDGESKPQLTANVSRDDVIRAHDGAFIGLAEDF